jgi:hypothetical protein
MNKEEHINKLIEDTINSVVNIKRAEPMPFLLSRVNARLNRAKENVWEKVVWFIGRPAIAIPGLIMLIVINGMVVLFSRADPFGSQAEQSYQAPVDEFSYTVATFDDIENTEP